jgi:tetratricopeptide (TPR) repeat protein
MKMRNIVFVTSLVFSVALNAQTIDQGRRQTRNEQYEDAAKTFEGLITKKPKLGDNYYWAGVNMLEAGDSAAAKVLFEKGLVIAPKYPLNMVGLGHIELRKGNTSGAEAQFAAAMKIGKKLKPIISREIARAYLLLQYGSPDYLKNSAQKAVDALKGAAETDFEAQLLLGDAYIITTPDDASKSIEQYTISGYQNPTDPRTKLRQAKVYSRVGNYDLSVSVINDALALDRDYAPAYRQKADIYNLMKRKDSAMNSRDSAVFYYKEYLKRNNNISARRMYAQALYLAGDFDEAITESKSIIKAQEAGGQKVFTNLYGIVAYAYADKRDTSVALNQEGLNYFDLYETKHIKPQSRELSISEKYVKANLLARTGNYDAAFALHTDVLKDTARCPARWYDQIQDYYNSKRLSEKTLAVIDLKRIKQNGYLNARDLYFYAQSLVQTKRYDQALGYYKELVKIDTSYVQGYYKIATTHELMDQTDSTGKATEAYKVWMNRLNADQKQKYRQTIVQAYQSMVYFARLRKDYASVSQSYAEILKITPDDEDVIKAKKSVDDYLAKLAKIKAKQK